MCDLVEIEVDLVDKSMHLLREGGEEVMMVSMKRESRDEVVAMEISLVRSLLL